MSAADRAILFLESLKLSSGRHAGKKLRLRDWQRQIIRNIYAERGGKRFVRTALISCGRKNGKTQLAAALTMLHLCGPLSEPRGECYSAASDRNQAARIFRELEAMIHADEDLSSRINIQRFAKRLEVMSGEGAGSIYEALSHDARKAHSLSPSFAVCDEVAQWPSRSLFDNLVTGTGARDTPLVVAISTKSSDPNHIMSELVSYGESVNAGVIKDSSFYAAIFSTPLDADIFEERHWYAANPALGDFRSLEEMRKFAEQARRLPGKEAVFRNLYLNQQADAVTSFVSQEVWKDNGAAPSQLDGARVRGGLDLSSVSDLTALELLDQRDGSVHTFAWLPEEGLAERARQDKVPYDVWAREGKLLTTPGRAISYDHIAQFLRGIFRRCTVEKIAFDRAYMRFLRPCLVRAGFTEAELTRFVEFGQGFFSQGPAIRELESRLLEKRLRHGMHPVLTMAAVNAVVVTDDAGNRKFTKRKSTGRIDPMVSLAMACAISAQAAEPEPRFQMFMLGPS